MSKAIIVKNPGDINSLALEQTPYPTLKDGQVIVQNLAFGVNWLDIDIRSAKENAIYPVVPGCEACGRVAEVGKDTTWRVGDRVGYITSKTGAYQEFVALDKKHLFAVPDHITNQQAAATARKAMMAHAIFRRVFYLQDFMTILIHGATGGMGMFLTQMAKYYGAKVIGVVSDDEKAKIAKKNGCDVVINRSKEDFVKIAKNCTSGVGVNVVIDGVGHEVFGQSIASLANFGLYVSYGDVSGAIDPFDMNILKEKSLFLTRPDLFCYKSYPYELVLSSKEIFEMLKKDIIKDNIGANFKFSENEVRNAHSLLESRKNIGSVVVSF